MLNGLVSKPKGNPSRTAEAFARVTASLQVAVAVHHAAKEAWEEALSDEALTLVGDKSNSNRLEGELNTAQREVSRLQAAAKVLEARQAADAASARHAFEVERWAQGESLAEARTAVVAKLAESAARFVSDYRELFNATTELAQALPSQPDPDGAVLRRDLLEIAVRKELVRLGLPWALSSAASLELEPITRQFQGIPGLITRWRNAALPTK